MTALDYLSLWLGGLVRVRLELDGIPTSYSARGELLNTSLEEPRDLGGWFIIVRSKEMRVPGVGDVELGLERYERSDVVENGDAAPAKLVFMLPSRATLTIEPVVEDPG